MKEEEGCCVVCAKICHKGHTLAERRLAEFYCDCSLAGHCKALPQDIGIKEEGNTTIIKKKYEPLREDESLCKRIMKKTIGIYNLFNRY